jgi:hypothetical protein
MAAPDILAAVRAHALAHYEQDGWDVIVECYEDAELAELLRGCNTPDEAIAQAGRAASTFDEARRAVQREAF